MTEGSGIMCVGVFGGVGMQPQIARIREGADVVVGTPGRILDIALTGNMRLGNVRKLVLDEVDEMLEVGFRTQIGRVIDLLPKKRQNLLFSATMTEEIKELTDTYFNGPELIEAAPVGTPIENIGQTVYEVANFNTKMNLLMRLLEGDEEMTRVMVFVGTIALADEVYERMADWGGVSVDYLHSKRTQSQRFGALRKFRDGETRVLIATDLVARGIDVEGVSHVVCFDMPNEPEQYIHRIGRTGRKDAKGRSIAFVSESELHALADVEGLMKMEISRSPLPEGVETSDLLEEWEKPTYRMRNQLVELDAKGGGAFHEKSEKNKKVNHKVPRFMQMKMKYGKPKKRRPKK
jgi:ATP-dependent RNA helicase RhlE